MLLNKHRLITERQQRAWSQSQLAEASAVSLRTIQRIEKNGKASLESSKAIAAVFDLKITDLYIPEPKSVFIEKIELEQNIEADSEAVLDVLSEGKKLKSIQFCFLSASTKTMTVTVFLLATLVLLFMSWTGISKLLWINKFRDSVFSEQLSASTLNVISISLTMLLILIVVTLLGLIFDSIRNQGLYLFIKRYIQSEEFSVYKVYSKSQLVARSLGKFLLKVVIIASTIIIISAGAIYLDMEEYQKHNMTRFLEKHF